MAWLSKADLKGATLRDANLQEAKINDANLEAVDLAGARRHYATFQGTNMEGCRECPLDWER
ncbi:Pentapeptide repeats (8 copies) [compost metagenome]